MGIKTKFNPMGGQNEKGKLSDWRYSTADNGQITLYEYLGTYSSAKPVYVPMRKGKTVITDTNDFSEIAGAQATYSNKNILRNSLLSNASLVYLNADYGRMGNSYAQLFDSSSTMIANFNGYYGNFTINLKGYPEWNKMYVVQDSTVININFYKGSNPPFYNNPNVIGVDLQKVPFVNNNMANAFYNCQNLTFVNNINPNVINMVSTFNKCNSLNQNIQIPNGVINMSRTFTYCYNLNQNIQIPNSVTDMSYTLYNCQNFNQNIQIPNSVTNMVSTFFNCINLNQPIQIPNSVTNMHETFSGCSNLNQNMQIPNSVTNMYQTFENCISLNQNIQIPNSVTNMYYTFYKCQNLQATITISSANIVNTYNCFNGSGLTKNVIFPLRYINNVNTVTRNTLVTAATGGYAVGTAVGNLVNNTAQNAVFYAYDPIAWEGYNAWTGNGTHWILNKWGGIGKAAGQTNIKVPTSITSYDTFPTAIDDGCFTSNDNLVEIDCSLVPSLPAASSNYFRDMANAEYIYNFNCSSATQLHAFVYNSQKLNSFSTGTPQMGTFFLDMPSAVTNAQAMVGHTKNFSNYYLLSDSMGSGTHSLKMYTSFQGVNAQPYNIYFTHTTWANATNWTRYWNSSHRKNAYIYFTYANGVATNIYNAFNGASWRGTSGGGLDKDPMYNSTSNCYAYNMSKHFCPTNNASWWCSPVNGALQYTGVGYSDDDTISFPTSLSVRQYPDRYTTVSTNTQDMSNMFNGFFKINSWIDVPSTATNLSWAFANCYSLNQPITNYGTSGLWVTWGVAIPNSVTDLSFAFYGCSNLNQKVEVVNSVTNLCQTFRYATGLQGNVFIYSQDVTNAQSCFGSTWLEKNVYLPFKYSNGVNTQTFNSFLAAGYIFTNGVSNSQHGVTVYDLNA